MASMFHSPSAESLSQKLICVFCGRTFFQDTEKLNSLKSTVDADRLSPTTTGLSGTCYICCSLKSKLTI